MNKWCYIGYDKDNLNKAKEVLEDSIKARKEELKYRQRNNLPVDQGHKDRIEIEDRALALVKGRLDEL